MQVLLHAAKCFVILGWLLFYAWFRLSPNHLIPLLWIAAGSYAVAFVVLLCAGVFCYSTDRDSAVTDLWCAGLAAIMLFFYWLPALCVFRGHGIVPP